MDYIAVSLSFVSLAIAFYCIWQNCGIRYAQTPDKQYIYPTNQRNIAAVFIIFSFVAVMIAGSIFTFEITGNPEKSNKLATMILRR